MASQRGSLLKRLLLLALVVLVAGGVAFWYFVLRDDAPPKLSLKDDTSGQTTTTAGSSGSPSTDDGGSASGGGLAGTWTVVPGSGDEATVAGYRVQEKFAGGAAKVTAAGRTNDVTGTITATDSEVTKASITVDMTTLQSDKAQRDNAIKGRGLETDEFPKATFELTSPITLPAIAEGKVFTVSATGKLTLHGVTKDVTIELNAKRSGDQFHVQGELPITMADYDIDPPSVGGFVEVDDNGSMEFLLALQRS